jgi:hypothetical protein
MLIFPFLLWIVGKGGERMEACLFGFGLFEHKLTTLVKTQFA